jgi:hypothetical protein
MKHNIVIGWKERFTPKCALGNILKFVFNSAGYGKLQSYEGEEICTSL